CRTEFSGTALAEGQAAGDGTDRQWVLDDRGFAGAAAASGVGHFHGVHARLADGDAVGGLAIAPGVALCSGRYAEFGGSTFAAGQATGDRADRRGGHFNLHLAGALATIRAGDGDRVDTRGAHGDATGCCTCVPEVSTGAGGTEFRGGAFTDRKSSGDAADGQWIDNNLHLAS